MSSVMEHSAASHHWVTEAADLAAKEQGAGNLLRVVLIVMVVGCVLVGWFLLRGYKQGQDEGEGRGEGPGQSQGESQGQSRSQAEERAERDG
ncbi:hypothetical protein ACFWY6_27495 [Streptomyces sp. NPDC059037]|uniref:hypothetical protein n=1 Tax=Streptomyces sp. NPDC059037 TaxID=3346710 RepID=UPI0036BBDA8B